MSAQETGPQLTTAPAFASPRPGLPDVGASTRVQRIAARDEPAPPDDARLLSHEATHPGAPTALAATRLNSSRPLPRPTLAPPRERLALAPVRPALSPSQERPSLAAQPLLQHDTTSPAPTSAALPVEAAWQRSPATRAVAANSPSMQTPMPMPTLQRRAANSMVDRLSEPAPAFGERATEPAREAASEVLRPATISTPAAAPPAAAPDLEALVERTCARLFETLAIEQERRGVSAWL